MPRVLLLVPPLLLGCLSPGAREDLRRLESEAERAPPPARTEAAAQPSAAGSPAAVDPSAAASPSAAAPPSAVDPSAADSAAVEPAPRGDELPDPLDLRALIRIALERNPAALEAQERSRAALENVRGAGSLDDPRFKVETEAVPLKHPGSFGRAEDNMFGLSQMFPFPGKLGLRSEAALREAEAARQVRRATQSEIVALVQRAYTEYFLLVKEREIHLEHVRLLEDFERIAEAKFRNGAVPQQDVLKAQLELVMLHNDVIDLERRLARVRAEFNALLNRPPGAYLGPPRDVTPRTDPVSLRVLMDRAITARPELLAAEAGAAAREREHDLARRDAVLPDFEVGVDYWSIPGEDDAWGGFVAINLPWLTGKRRAEARRLAHAARADRLAIERARQQVHLEVQDAYLRLQSARASISLVSGELLPKSAQSVDVTRASYQNDRASFLELLDAERSNRDVQLSHYRAIAQYEAALADLERAAGVNLEDQP